MTSVDKTIDNQINVWKERIDELKEEINSHPFKFNLGFIFKQDSYHPQYRTIRENEIMQLRQKISKEEEYNLMIFKPHRNIGHIEQIFLNLHFYVYTCSMW